MFPDEIVIGPLESSDIEAAAALLTSALCTSPLHVALFGSPTPKTLRRQERMFSLLLRELPGERFVARCGGEITGVLRTVRSPLCRLPLPEASGLGPVVEEILGHAAGRVARWFERWVAHDPAQPHWHLGPFAVAVGWQRRGIGSALLRRFCEHLDERREAAQLEADRSTSVPFYQRFGFEVREEAALLGVQHHFLWRCARSATTFEPMGSRPPDGGKGPRASSCSWM